MAEQNGGKKMGAGLCHYCTNIFIDNRFIAIRVPPFCDVWQGRNIAAYKLDGDVSCRRVAGFNDLFELQIGKKIIIQP